jgi:hypothetical protein
MGSVLEELLGSGSLVGLGGMMILIGAMFRTASETPCTMLQLKVVGNVLEGFIEEGSIIWPCIVEGVVLDLLCFSSKLVAGSVVVVVPALAMTAIAPLAVVPSLLGR